MQSGKQCGKRKKFKLAQARNRTGGPTMATLDFTTKPLALSELENVVSQNEICQYDNKSP